MQVDYKLLFHQLFAAEIRKERVLAAGSADPEAALLGELAAHDCYARAGFNDALDAVCAAGSSDGAYEARRAIYESARGRREVASLDLARCGLGPSARRDPAAARLLEALEGARDRPSPADESFFDAPEGQAVMEALAGEGSEVALVMVPGYGAHTIRYCIFEEAVREANLLHGRPAERPCLRQDGIEIELEPHDVFYGRGDGGQGAFDILHPAGQELGNTTGPNAETADVIVRWLAELPEPYQRKRLVLLGYSKGAPIVFEMLRRHPELAARTVACVTFAGVVQGTHVARAALEQAGELLGDQPLSEFVTRLRRKDPRRLGRELSPLLSHVDLDWISVPRIRRVFEIFGYDLGPLERQVDRVLEGREVRELLDGWRDLSPLSRARWNLRHLDRETFGGGAEGPTPVFNLSLLTDVKSFVRPAALDEQGRAPPSLIVPVVGADGAIDWSRLSLDALFLYATSLDGFTAAPGGLYDTQVELANTKSPQLDRRPLAASLSAEELDELWDDRRLRAGLAEVGVTSREALASRPRRSLHRPGGEGGMDPIDLGELRGHHWSLFVQVLRPPEDLSQVYARWDFPRRPLMRALLEVIALRCALGGAPEVHP